MDYIASLALMIAGLLAISAVVIAKRPDAQQLVDKLVPFQGFLGVGLLAFGIIDLLLHFSQLSAQFTLWPFAGAVLMASIACEVLLGFLFGMPLIAAWIPGDTPAEQKALEMQQKIGAFSVLIGGVGLVAAVLRLLIAAAILTSSAESTLSINGN